MTSIRLASNLAVGAAVVLMVSSGCVRRTIVRDRGAIGDNKPREITMGDENTASQKQAPQPQVVVVQPPNPPPAPPAETRPPMPGSGYVWIDGRYEWRNSRWEWSPGYWDRRS